MAARYAWKHVLLGGTLATRMSGANAARLHMDLPRNLMSVNTVLWSAGDVITLDLWFWPNARLRARTR